jgi:hypothetical protein
MPCCDRTPFHVPRTDRITEDQSLVTCGLHEFDEDVDDYSMCMCGMPALTHYLVEETVVTPTATSAATKKNPRRKKIPSRRESF